MDDEEYTRRLINTAETRWKKVLHVQAPYIWNLKRLVRGNVLEIGCGIGRNLQHLSAASVGVDLSPSSVAYAKKRGMNAYLPEEFFSSSHARVAGFDVLLFCHVLEHLEADKVRGLISEYLDFLKPGGRVVSIVPQESGFRTDPTHRTFLRASDLGAIEEELGLRHERSYSFPFPRPFGHVFPYNETVSFATKLSTHQGAS